MRRALLFALILVAGLPLAAEEERNLVRNGSFEEGAAGTTRIPGFTEVDGLTTFFVRDPNRGRVLLIDTDVNLVEADARWEEMALPEADRPAAKPKEPTRPPKYDTVGGTTGAKIYSDYIRIEPDMRYRLRARVKSTGTTVMIFVKGYAELEGGFRKYYQCYKNVADPEPGWHVYERTFNPTAKTQGVTHIRVMPYAYWPAGQAWIDDIEVTRIGPEKRPGATSATSLIENGDFEAKTIDPWISKGATARIQGATESACARIYPGASLTSGRVEVKEDKEYVLRARVLPSGAILTATVEGLLRFGGEWVVMFEKKETAPPKAEDWLTLELPFHPTAESPQVTHARVRFSVSGKTGSACVDDVAMEPAKDRR